MAVYDIPAFALNKLEKKLAAIEKKCMQNDCYFSYKKLEDQKWIKDVLIEDERGINPPTHHYIEMIPVEVEGTAKVDDYKYIGSLEATPNGNIIHSAPEEAVPERYYDCELECEHCHTKAHRNKTYVVQNTETGEYKQVGSSCLALYTHGLDAEWAADFASMTALLDLYNNGDVDEWPRGWFSHISQYYPTKDVIGLSYEMVKAYGYVKVPADITYGVDKDNPPTLFRIQGALAEGRHGNPKVVETILNWLEEQPANDYIHNLQVFSKQDYVDDREAKFLASIGTAYLNSLKWKKEAELKKAEKEAADAARAEKLKTLEFVGKVGERIEFKVASWKEVTSFESAYGTTFLFKFEDTEGHIYTWFASSYPWYEDEEPDVIKGTIKEHKDYNGEKQTVLTRCRVTTKPAEEE